MYVKIDYDRTNMRIRYYLLILTTTMIFNCPIRTFHLGVRFRVHYSIFLFFSSFNLISFLFVLLPPMMAAPLDIVSYFFHFFYSFNLLINVLVCVCVMVMQKYNRHHRLDSS